MKNIRNLSDAVSDWICGLNPVLEALRAGRDIKAVYLMTGRLDNAAYVRNEADKAGVHVKMADNGFFDAQFPKGHQGIAARVSKKEYISLDELLVIPAKKNELPLFVVIDCVEDPRNFGAILRSADAAGVHGVVIQSHRSVSLGPEAAKSSAGAVEYVPVAMVSNIKHAMSRMRDEGITILGAEAEAHSAIWEADLNVPLAVVVGSEGKGMRRTVKENCDLLVNLPMKGKINSLNVSVAAGIMFFEILRQRLIKKPAI
jgi:23S rRNA (guanosine2251-2'-O)-methyltransferase